MLKNRSKWQSIVYRLIAQKELKHFENYKMS